MSTFDVMKSKKLIVSIFSIFVVFLLSIIVKNVEIAQTAITSVWFITGVYLGGQSGVDTMHKYKNPVSE